MCENVTSISNIMWCPYLPLEESAAAFSGSYFSSIKSKWCLATSCLVQMTQGEPASSLSASMKCFKAIPPKRPVSLSPVTLHVCQ